VFFVADCDASLHFYRKLGFREAWRHEESGAVVAAQVDRPGVELILNRNAQRAGSGRLFVSLNRGEVARCAREFAAESIHMQDAHWGMAVKVVRDPDGNDLIFRDDSLDG
jgi:catechol 2,3-dioxygenase-like lactoylglutathione lyase family enzyme